MTPVVIQHPSPNQNARPAGVGISAILLHADAGRSDAGTISWVTSPTSRVSYHYLVGRSGTIHQFVPDDRRAWHAGVSSFGGRPNCNDYTLGICFANNQQGEPFPDAQISAGVILVAAKCAEHGIPVECVTTHAAVALPQGRKHDPGELFPLAHFLMRVRAVLDTGVQP